MRTLLLAPLLAAGCFETEDLFTPGLIGLSTSSLAFTATEGGADPADQTFLLTNTGAGPLAWTADASSPWFTVAPASGTLAPGASILVTVHVDADFQLQAWEAATSTASAPAARNAHAAAFVNGQMIIWGGSNASSSNTQIAVGGRFDPLNNLWLGTTTTTGMPTERHLVSGVSTGAEMLVWGGWKFGVGFTNGGGRYAPDAWAAALDTAGAPLAREAHAAVWTGARMVVWGGWDGGAHLDSGGLFDAASDDWTGATATAGNPGARQEHVAVWTGSRMVVWGGRNGPTLASVLATGGLYDPVNNIWTGATAAPGATLTARTSPAAVWTGREMVVWGGHDGGGPMSTGARYSPATNAWLGVLATTGAPTARWGHSAVWTGARMVVWGGDGGAGASVDTGAIWRPPVPALGDHAESVTISAPGLAPAVVGVNLTVTP
ncbi:MAG TPA: hypothetical protein VF950_30325 [Planctomycetota bacterium]